MQHLTEVATSWCAPVHDALGHQGYRMRPKQQLAVDEALWPHPWRLSLVVRVRTLPYTLPLYHILDLPTLPQPGACSTRLFIIM